MPLELMLALLGVFASVAVVAGGLASLVLVRASPGKRRLRKVAQAEPGLLRDLPQLADTPDPRLEQLSRALARSPQEMSRLRKRLAKAGSEGFASPVAYAFAEMLLPVLFAVVVLLVLGIRDGWILALVVSVLGYLLPGLWLQRRTARRQKLIQNALPDALDLFIVCMEAGSSLDQAIMKATEELELTHPELTKELRLITTEIRAGKPRLEAFKNFAKRTGVDDVRALVSMLVQTDRFGTSVAQALRSHAATSRTKRRQAAEERAGKVGVKLVFPLVLCLFPAVYIVCMGPVIIRIYRSFL